MEVPPDAEVDSLPDVLHWLLLVEKWGFPISGGYLEQPWYFIQDIEAAMVGRARVDEIREANTRMRRDYQQENG